MQVQITLNRDGVAVPIQRAALVSIDVIAAALTAFTHTTLSKPTMPNQFIKFQVRGPDMDSDQRRVVYENWLLAKGFRTSHVASGLPWKKRHFIFALYQLHLNGCLPQVRWRICLMK